MDITLLLIIAGAGLIIGLLIGLMINALRGDSSRRVGVPPEIEGRAIDNILLWHDRSGGNLIVDLDGATFTELNLMRNDQRARLETCYGQLKRFMGIQEPIAQTGAGKSGRQSPNQPRPSATPLEPAVETVQPVPIKLTLSKKVVIQPIKPLSIVAEIDEILQGEIEATPLAERGLKLLETPNHTISVCIDNKQYQNIDEVLDPKIQEIIHAAVRKWEDKVP
ncbi:MAG: hypothetical protein WBV22_06715 [Anaerolineaceae bacterium]